ESIQTGNPCRRSRAFEQQRQITGDSEKENSIDVVMDSHTRIDVQMESRPVEADSSGNCDCQNKSTNGCNNRSAKITCFHKWTRCSLPSVLEKMLSPRIGMMRAMAVYLRSFLREI